MLPLSLLAATLIAPVPDISAKYTSAGLEVSAQGVPVIRGSWFQYYAPGWTRGYFSSRWNAPRLTGSIDDQLATYSSQLVSATVRTSRSGNRITKEYRFGWNSDEPAKVELCIAMPWAPAFAFGSATADGRTLESLSPRTYSSDSDLEPRTYASEVRQIELKAPHGVYRLEANIPLRFFDARGYAQDFARQRELFWIGNSEIEVRQGQETVVTVTLDIDPIALPSPGVQSETLGWTPVPDARVPRDEPWPLVPKPTSSTLDYSRLTEWTGLYTYPAGVFRQVAEFERALRTRFEGVRRVPGGKPMSIDGGIATQGRLPGGYTINVRPDGFSVLGGDEHGLRLGLIRLAHLAIARDGKIFLPQGFLLANPAVGWRGVHLFVGPEAPRFHEKLRERVLLPLGFNKVVLQCERTRWSGFESNRNPEWMSTAGLKSLFDAHRRRGLEPIPLIQSWGHMGWFFEGDRRLELAFNREEPFAIDPRNPEARKAVERIWDEAVALLEPEAMHFGLDEVNLRGGPSDEELLTQMWESHLPFVGSIAKRHNRPMILWGDKALAPGEAPDATHAPDKPHALRRRAAIPKGSYIADWHYKADARSEGFARVLQLWEDAGMRPIASTWYRPENIQGFAQAAIALQTGFLQTTWAGYFSNEFNMLREIDQFQAMVLAGDYAFSGRREAWNKIGYDPADVFRLWYFDPPQPLSARAGSLASRPGSRESERVRIGTTRFMRWQEPVALRSVVLPDGANRPEQMVFPITLRGNGLALLGGTSVGIDENVTVALIEILQNNRVVHSQEVRYGHDVRSSDDTRPTNRSERGANGHTSVVVSTNANGAATLRITGRDPAAGFSLWGLSLY